MIPMSTANRGTWTTHIHNKPNVWKNSAPQERPFNSKVTLHTNAQAHTIYIYIFFLSFKNTSARASIVQGGEGTAWSWYVWHFFFSISFHANTAIPKKKKKDVDVVGLQCITQRMPERQFYSLKVMWVTVAVGDHRTLWMPSHLWQCPLLMSQVYRVLENYIYEKGFHCLPGFANPRCKYLSEFAHCPLQITPQLAVTSEVEVWDCGKQANGVHKRRVPKCYTAKETYPWKWKKKVKTHQDINCIRRFANAIHTATTHQ